MKTKLGQFLLIAVIGLVGVLSASAQQTNLDGYRFIGNKLKPGNSLKQGEGIRDEEKTLAAVLQKDGNFCLYKLDSKNINRGNFMGCTMTVGSEDKKGATLTLSETGMLELFNSKGKPIWSRDATGRNLNPKAKPEKGTGFLEVGGWAKGVLWLQGPQPIGCWAQLLYQEVANCN